MRYAFTREGEKFSPPAGVNTFYLLIHKSFITIENNNYVPINVKWFLFTLQQYSWPNY